MTARDHVVLRAAGACVVVDLTPGTPPRLLHYGADLGAEVDGEVVRAAVTRPVPISSFAIPIHPGLLPVEADGWLGRPGLAGHRGGRQLLPRLVLGAVTTADGSRLTISTGDDDAGVGVARLARWTPARWIGSTEVREKLGGGL